MTNKDIIRLALEHFGAVLKPSDLEVKLAALAAAAEREACAKVCEKFINDATDWDSGVWDQAVDRCADAIRARGSNGENT